MQITKNILNQLKNEPKRHFSVDEIFSKLFKRGISRESVVKALGVLENEGRIIHKKGAGFHFRSPDEDFVGIFKANRKGHGFVSLPADDVYISPSKVHGAFHGDTVRVRLGRKPGPGMSQEAKIVEVLTRANLTIIGRFEQLRNSGIVMPVNDRVFYEFVISPKDFSAACTGDIVEIEILSWPLTDKLPTGRVLRVIGHDTEPGMDITMIVMAHSWPQDFTEEALAASEKTASAVTDEDTNERLDLRNEFTVTIDGLDAKDFDDALSLTIDDRGHFQLGVHIADVSHYVSPDSPLDKDARVKTTSMYLPDRVIPMLPPKLSNGICSLKPHVDRLAVSVIMELDPDGNIVNFKVTPSVIQSDSRLTYEEVDRHMSKGLIKDVQVDRLLRSLQTLCGVLGKKRLARGSLNFETIEPKLVLDTDGRPLEILIRERTTATQMIEETMILTNEAVAEFMLRRNAPMVFRVHDRPDPDAVFSITKLLAELGYPKHSLQKADPRAFQALIDFAHSRPEKLLINSLLLRAMNRAKYSPTLIPHFGLASQHYTHFTSPIRRYPDLLVHRLIKAVLSKKLGSVAMVSLAKQLQDLCDHCSFQERVAESASREAVAIKITEYMKDHIGTVSTTVISGVTQYGLFVQLENSAEGLVHIRTLRDDYYKFEPERYSLKGQRTGQIYRLGQTVTVELIKASVSERQLDFVIVQ